MMAEDALGKSFITALLITGSVEQAEAAVLKSISFLGPYDASGEKLLRGALKAALQAPGMKTPPTPRELERAFSLLPFELQCVLHLTADLRYCFICRVLADLPRRTCAALLRLELPEVDKRTYAAVRLLVSIKQRQGPQKKYARAIEQLKQIWLMQWQQ
jgi:hypothetical protein